MGSRIFSGELPPCPPGTPAHRAHAFQKLLIFTFIGKAETEAEKEKTLPFIDSLPTRLQQLGLGRAKVGSPELSPGLPSRWQVQLLEL